MIIKLNNLILSSLCK